MSDFDQRAPRRRPEDGCPDPGELEFGRALGPSDASPDRSYPSGEPGTWGLDEPDAVWAEPVDGEDTATTVIRTEQVYPPLDRAQAARFPGAGEAAPEQAAPPVMAGAPAASPLGQAAPSAMGPAPAAATIAGPGFDAGAPAGRAVPSGSAAAPYPASEPPAQAPAAPAYPGAAPGYPAPVAAAPYPGAVTGAPLYPGAVPPRPSDTPRSPAAAAAGWLAAALGGFGAVIAAQLAAAVVGSFALTLVFLALNPTAGTDETLAAVLGPVMLASQLACLAVFLPWWLHLRPVSFARTRRPRGRAGAAAVTLRVLSIAILGIGMQMAISYLLTYLLPLAPQLDAEYAEVINDPVTSEFTLLSVIVLAVGAPVSEELACRGVIFEFALRALNPGHAPRWRDRSWRRLTGAPEPVLPPVPPARFWAANAVQALLFGVLHMNLVQGLYAFVMGLVLGWVVWRTGHLGYSIGLHLVVNFMSYFVGIVSGTLEMLGVPFAIAASFGLVALGVALFALATRRDAAPADGAGPLQGASPSAQTGA